MVLHRAGGEDRQDRFADPDGPPFHFEAPAGEIVAQEQLAQILRVHAVGHARGVRVPRHQVVHRRAPAQQRVVGGVRPDQVARAQ